MRISKITIKNFRSIKDSGEISEITKIFALIGRNNAGKSSVLKAIQVLFVTKDIKLADFHKNSDEPIEISATLCQTTDDTEKETELMVICTKEALTSEYFLNGTKVQKTKYKDSLPELLCIDDIRIPNESNTEGQRSSLLNKILKLGTAAKENERYKELSEELRKLKQEEALELSDTITKKFQSVIHETSYSVRIYPTVDIEKGVIYHTSLLDANIPKAQNVDILNSGTGLQSMYILTLLEVWAELSKINDQAILIVEEPEVYLHPEYQRRMFAALRRIAENNQVIFTTHSPIMISDIWLTESVRQVRLNDKGETLIENVKIEEVIDELGIRYEDVLNPSRVVFVEGESDIKFYEAIGIKHPKLKIISSDGFRAIHCFAFIKIISSEHVNNSFFVIADGDGEVETERQEYLKQAIVRQFKDPPEKLTKNLSEKIMVLREYSIESYFLVPETLTKSFPLIDEREIRTFIAEYKSTYNEKLDSVGKGKLTKQEFQKYMKPKIIFESYSVPEFKTAYRNFWDGKETFLKIKEAIAEECTQLTASKKSWF
jgi:predicted ATP-dependent endonuclease of OLD family